MIRKMALVAGLACAFPALALDSVSLETGSGDEGTEVLRAGAQWTWQQRWFTERSWTLGAYWDVQAGRWTGTTDDLWDFSVTPVFRLERARRSKSYPYVEAAIGFHILSDIRVNPQRRFSTNFQYGDHIGVGLRYGERYRYDLGLRLQHLSNGGLSKPNPGINFWQLRLQYHFK